MTSKTSETANVSSREYEVDRLEREHRELEQRLLELDRRPFLNPAEELERKTIQKLKLRTKDRLFSLTRGDRVFV